MNAKWNSTCIVSPLCVINNIAFEMVGKLVPIRHWALDFIEKCWFDRCYVLAQFKLLGIDKLVYLLLKGFVNKKWKKKKYIIKINFGF